MTDEDHITDDVRRDLERYGSFVADLPDGRRFVLAVVMGPDGMRGVVVALEGSGSLLWDVGAKVPTRYDLLGAGIPYMMAPAVEEALAVLRTGNPPDSYRAALEATSHDPQGHREGEHHDGNQPARARAHPHSSRQSDD